MVERETETKLSQEIQTLVTILRHQKFVAHFLVKFAHALENRAIAHDQSKLSLEEFGGFVNVQRIAREQPYNSPDYKAVISSQTVQLHFKRNSHHQEFYASGIADMSLFDIIEMVIDWKAASLTYGQTSLKDSLKVQIERFSLRSEHLYLIQLILAELEN